MLPSHHHRTTAAVHPIQLRKSLSAGTWNIRSLSGTGAACLLVVQLSRAHINIMGLQEVRWHYSGELTVQDYKLHWSGPPTVSTRQGGVAIAMDQLAARALISWRPINDRLLTATFQHSLGQLQVIVAYAPTELAAADVKDSFYQYLEHTLSSLQPAQPTLILGDFSAVTGRQRDPHRTVVGPHGHGTPNDNTERLLNFCVGGGFRIGGHTLLELVFKR